MTHKIPTMYYTTGRLSYSIEFINRKTAILTIEDHKYAKEHKEIWILAKLEPHI